MRAPLNPEEERGENRALLASPQHFSALMHFPFGSPAAVPEVSNTLALPHSLAFVPFYLWRVRLASSPGNDV